jgi:hypothetical protein
MKQLPARLRNTRNAEAERDLYLSPCSGPRRGLTIGARLARELDRTRRRESWFARWLFRRFGGAGEGDSPDWEHIRCGANRVLEDVHLPPPLANRIVEPVETSR